MADKHVDGLYVSEKRTDVQKMKTKLEQQEEKYLKMQQTGEMLTTFGTPVLIGSLLSPFDFEGPVIEIISGCCLVGGMILKKIASKELEEIEALKTTGEYKYVPVTSKFKQEDIKLMEDTASKIKARADQKKANKTSRSR